MLKRLHIVLVIVMTALLSSIFATRASMVSYPSVSAEHAVLIDAESGEILFAKNAEKRAPMASTTKIMTAVIALENTTPEQKVCIQAGAVGVEGSSAYLTEGEILTMEQLLYALLLRSANDAAVAIALEVSGSIEDFAALMNKKADELRLTDTHFENPHGLDSETHYTSAKDLALLSSYALKNESFAKIVSTYKKSIPLGDKEDARLLVNHNKLLRSYDGAIGVKTGFTKKSGRCLVSAANRDSLTLISVTLNAPDDWNDHSEMLDWGFENYRKITLFEADEYKVPLNVAGGKEDFVLCSNIDKITATLPSDFSMDNITIKTEAPHIIYAPIQEKSISGKLTVLYNGNIIGESELYAVYEVESVPPKLSLWQKIAAFVISLFGGK